ncbi:MAG: hypothetical protein H6R23_2819 [Proteobacteria bacterium]|nr:hypothetical protein [Pseudomonadota bacterium]
MLLGWAANRLLAPPILVLVEANRLTRGWFLISARIHRFARRPPRHDVVDLLRINGFVLDQGVGHGVQFVKIVPQQSFGTLVVAIDDGADFLVDHMGGLVGDVLVPGHAAAQEYLAVVLAVG